MDADFTATEYLRERLDPQPGDPLYLCLSDLRLALQEMIPSGLSRVLDYGCGGSPYRTLFGECTYHRADLAGGHSLDFEYGPNGLLPATSGDYDCVLSTQVLEHVEDPGVYLSECRRVLRPRGRLILTTHGSYEDHGCPYDYWRWTAFGLQKIVERAGLRVNTVKKLTTGPRGILSLSERELYRIRFRESGWYGLALSLGIRAVQRLGARRLHKASDASFSGNRVVDMHEPGHDVYVCVALTATCEN